MKASDISGPENLPVMTNYGAYDPSLEWPGDLDNPDTPCNNSEPSTSYKRVKNFRPNQPTFRLVVLHSSVLPSYQKLAVIDGHSEIQFGRDRMPTGSTTPRIRLKEMEVSKLHATAYWDAKRREWGIVDMGSVHGTYLRSSSAMRDDRGVRLSPSRQASIPRTLKHLDRLTIGGTAFIVHMHKSHLPCEECWLNGQEDIPLFSYSRATDASTPDHTGSSLAEVGIPSARDAKQALTLLKHNLMARHFDFNLSKESNTQYVDRSARRRALMPDLSPITTGDVSSRTEPRPRYKSPAAEPVSKPPAPVPTTNIGHCLLMKQGWQPGTALGQELDPRDGRIVLIHPLEIDGNSHRAGVGAKRSTTSGDCDTEWRETAKRQRWESYR